MSIYDEMQEVAAEILGDPEFKQGVIRLISMTPGSGPADNPGASTAVTTELDAVAKGVSFKYLREGFVVSSDVEVTAAVVAGVTPSLRDFIDIDGVRHKILQDVSPPAAGTRVVWKFIVRKGG